MKFQRLFKLGMDRNIPDIVPFPKGEILNLGAGNKLIPNSVSLDLPEWDAEISPIPRERNTVAGIYAFHFLEHIKNLIFVLQESERVLKPGGSILSVVPYYKSSMAFQDINHENFFTEDTWKELFNNSYYNTEGEQIKLVIHFNIIVGIVERNLALFSQLVKKEK